MATPPPQPSADVLFDRQFVTLYQALDADTCREIVSRFDTDDRKRQGEVYRGEDAVGTLATDIKRSWDLEILDDARWGDLFRRLHPRVLACLSHYLARSPVLRSLALQGTGYKIQMYPRNEGYFHWHADSSGRRERSRVVALILYLNDVERGGETEFLHQDLKVAPRTGRLLVFPAGWNYVHRGGMPESGDKYIVQTFVRIKD